MYNRLLNIESLINIAIEINNDRIINKLDLSQLSQDKLKNYIVKAVEENADKVIKALLDKELPSQEYRNLTINDVAPIHVILYCIRHKKLDMLKLLANSGKFDLNQEYYMICWNVLPLQYALWHCRNKADECVDVLLQHRINIPLDIISDFLLGKQQGASYTPYRNLDISTLEKILFAYGNENDQGYIDIIKKFVTDIGEYSSNCVSLVVKLLQRHPQIISRNDLTTLITKFVQCKGASVAEEIQSIDILIKYILENEEADAIAIECIKKLEAIELKVVSLHAIDSLLSYIVAKCNDSKILGDCLESLTKMRTKDLKLTSDHNITELLNQEGKDIETKDSIVSISLKVKKLQFSQVILRIKKLKSQIYEYGLNEGVELLDELLKEVENGYTKYINNVLSNLIKSKSLDTKSTKNTSKVQEFLSAMEFLVGEGAKIDESFGENETKWFPTAGIALRVLANNALGYAKLVFNHPNTDLNEYEAKLNHHILYDLIHESPDKLKVYLDACKNRNIEISCSKKVLVGSFFTDLVGSFTDEEMDSLIVSRGNFESLKLLHDNYLDIIKDSDLRKLLQSVQNTDMEQQICSENNSDNTISTDEYDVECCYDELIENSASNLNDSDLVGDSVL